MQYDQIAKGSMHRGLRCYHMVEQVSPPMERVAHAYEPMF